MTKVLLYTPEPVAALGFTFLLGGASDLELVGTSAQIEDLPALVRDKEPNVLLLDLSPGVTFQLLKDLRRQFSSCKVLIWVNEISMEIVFQVMALGIRGIARKTISPETLINCLRRVDQGELWFEKSLTENMLKARIVTLTWREGQLVTLLSQGMKNKEIATVLTVSENTVKVYLSRLFDKTGTKDRWELAIYGLRNVAMGQGRLDDPLEKPWGSKQGIVGLRSLVVDDLGTKAA